MPLLMSMGFLPSTISCMPAYEKLLATTDYSLSVISHTCGFSSSSYFSQTFKKVAGVSPSSYRKTVKSDHGEMEDLSR